MKFKILLFSALIVSASLNAQTKDQRESIKKSNNNVTLKNVQNEFQKQFNQDEINVAEYLKKNPQVNRSFSKNRSNYYIKRIDKNGKPVYIKTKSNIESGTLIKANELYNGGSIGANITGTNMIAGIWDGGQVKATHELLLNKVIMQTGQTVTSTDGNNHMTHVSGTMVGSNIGNSARGIAYNATAKCYDWTNDLTEMAIFASDGYLVSNHSYGPANDTTVPMWQFGAYDEGAKNLDLLTKSTPFYQPFIAGGNEQSSNGSGKTGPLQGYDVMTSYCNAKNAIIVGGVNADRGMSDYSNFGPADDGRIKPDICARGTGINSSTALSNNSYSGSGVDSSGTSYATPAAAASALLLQQYFFSLKGNYMKASMLKALLLHSADDEGSPGPDNKFGWGILNIERAANIIKNSNGGGSEMSFVTINPINDDVNEIVINGIETENTPVRLSFCWTDNEGVEQIESDGIDNTNSRLVYNFKPMVRNQTNLADFYPWLDSSISNPTANVEIATSFAQGGKNNYKQINVSNINTNSILSLFIRKTSSSPVQVREIAIIATGLKINPLQNSEFNIDINPIVFYDKNNNMLRLISDKIKYFNEFSIFDISGKQLQKGTTFKKELNLENFCKGIYIINFKNDNKNYNVKFVIQ